ncbi:hypothetical protein CHLRE_10g444317v5 [Chlamydomonas reinhardtii]|uniref:Uncharacterized protein n=1 Tax=Chlamydomonas reinhardtii TaxID=3055 RepID=A0A2K3DAQ8_CHLRE|nr:uncharacterized protein CHLRE_10g444317v5 [Chlamydomonas reinhardtii]PNW77612.1 hypothetical protein CHLRE_10g444317v5 [Chlamydomonas reinhardtii]
MLSSQCVDCTPPCLHAEEVHTPPGHAQLRRVLHQLPVRLRPPLQHLGRHAATAPATARRCSHTRGRAGRTREVVRDAVGCAVHQSGAVRAPASPPATPLRLPPPPLLATPPDPTAPTAPSDPIGP